MRFRRFLFAALNILEPLYDACLERMQGFLDELASSGERHRPEKFTDFRDELLVLNRLQSERRVDSTIIARLTQRDEPYARGVLERLVERGLIQARGEQHGRVYHLSAALYRRLGVPAGAFVPMDSMSSSKRRWCFSMCGPMVGSPGATSRNSAELASISPVAYFAAWSVRRSWSLEVACDTRPTPSRMSNTRTRWSTRTARRLIRAR